MIIVYTIFIQGNEFENVACNMGPFCLILIELRGKHEI